MVGGICDVLPRPNNPNTSVVYLPVHRDPTDWVFQAHLCLRDGRLMWDGCGKSFNILFLGVNGGRTVWCPVLLRCGVEGWALKVEPWSESYIGVQVQRERRDIESHHEDVIEFAGGRMKVKYYPFNLVLGRSSFRNFQQSLTGKWSRLGTVHWSLLVCMDYNMQKAQHRGDNRCMWYFLYL